MVVHWTHLSKPRCVEVADTIEGRLPPGKQEFCRVSSPGARNRFPNMYPKSVLVHGVVRGAC